MVRIHDTMAGADVELTTRVPDRVSMYVCGPTVYDAPHIGHGRTALAFDMVRRYLTWRGYDVTYVSNVTNVEDKIIARAAREGMSEQDLADHWESVYWEALDRLGVAKPDEIPRATEFIDQMIALIGELVASGHAYVIEGEGVYFAVEAYPGYGQLSHRRVEDLLSSAGRASTWTSASAAPSTSRCGRRRSPASRTGTHRGVAADPVGTSSAPPCRSSCSASRSTSTAVGTISSSPTTRTSARRRRQPVIRSPGIGSTRAW